MNIDQEKYNNRMNYISNIDQTMVYQKIINVGMSFKKKIIIEYFSNFSNTVNTTKIIIYYNYYKNIYYNKILSVNEILLTLRR